MPKIMIWAWIKNFIGSEPSLDTKVLCFPQIQIGKEANIMFKLNGRLGRLLLKTRAWIKSFIGSEPSLDTKVLLLASDPDWKGSKYNVQVEWETGEITFEPLSIIAADDPVTCAAYAKENNLLALEIWCRFRNLAKKDKVLARAIKQSRIRQVRRSQTYMFGYLIPRNYMEAMQFDSENKISKWYDAIKLEMESMLEYKVFKKWDKAILDKHKKVMNSLKVIIGLKFI